MTLYWTSGTKGLIRLQVVMTEMRLERFLMQSRFTLIKTEDHINMNGEKEESFDKKNNHRLIYVFSRKYMKMLFEMFIFNGKGRLESSLSFISFVFQIFFCF